MRGARVPILRRHILCRRRGPPLRAFYLERALDVFYIDFPGKPVWTWVIFLLVVLALLVFHLVVLHPKSYEIGMRESLLLSAVYISFGLLLLQSRAIPPSPTRRTFLPSLACAPYILRCQR